MTRNKQPSQTLRFRCHLSKNPLSHRNFNFIRRQISTFVLEQGFEQTNFYFMYYARLYIALTLAGFSDAFFRMSCPGRLVRERIDPIVSAGKVAGHIHSVSGGSGWSPSMTFKDARSAKCTSCEIKVSFRTLQPGIHLTTATGGSLKLLDPAALRQNERQHIPPCSRDG